MSEPCQALPILLSARDVRAVFDRSDRTLRRWIRQGHLPAVRVGGAVFFHECDVRRLIAGELRAAIGSPSAVPARAR